MGAMADGAVRSYDRPVALTYAELTRRFEAGARIEEVSEKGLGRGTSGSTPLFALTEDGRLRVMTDDRPTALESDEKGICLSDP